MFKKAIYLLLSAFVFMVACTGSSKKSSENGSQAKQSTAPEINAESRLLINYLAENGDYVNSREFPSLISPESVKEALDGKTLVIDMRKPEIYAKGHIKGAKNVEISGLPDYFSTKIKPFEYDKIILACYSGQSSSYATSLLRLMGYGNVYSMRWGMSGWNKKMENKWLANISPKYEDRLDTTDNPKGLPNDFPKLNTGKTTGAEIFDERVKPIFSQYEEAVISVDTVFAHPEKYYIVNFERKDKYTEGHVPGAIRYKPDGTLGIVGEMQTLPTDREIVVYCGTGHNSAFVTAYLRLFGYKAKTMRFGNNGFMHDKMVREKETMSWQPYTESDTKDFPVEK